MYLPITTTVTFLIAVTTISSIAFHLLFVKYFPLGEIGLKKIDYLWIVMGVLGLSTKVVSNRQDLSKHFLGEQKKVVMARANWVKDRIEAGTGPAVCRSFVRSQFSPPEEIFKKRQAEFDSLCEWFREASKVKDSVLSTERQVSLENFVPWKTPMGADPDFIKSVSQAISEYNQAVGDYNLFSEASSESELEHISALLSPYLLAIAIGLRITKTTGEIRISKGKLKAR